MTKIAVMVGSLSDASINKVLAKNLEKLAPTGVEFVYADLNLPLYNYELEAEFPTKAKELKDLIESVDGVLLVTPEYNRSFSAVLKNALEWASRPWGKNSFDGVPAGVIGSSIGPIGAAQAQSNLRSVMVYLNTKVMGQPELYINGPETFDEDGNVVEGQKDRLQKYIEAFSEHVDNCK